VGIWSGPGDAPLGEALRAASSSWRVRSVSGLDSMVVLSLYRCPPYKTSWSSEAIWGCSLAMELSFLTKDGMGHLLHMGRTLLKHSGSVSSCRALLFASIFALAIFFQLALLRLRILGSLLPCFCIDLIASLSFSRSLFQKAFAPLLALGVCWSKILVRDFWT